ncbi:tyrosine-type recombinase/integrase [Natronomonas sp. CBA1123]|uniref:tyrosine-type recombinase/integrase n=1 Tax=Natronomonas sp. CBA1123 TaxID=2668070 RepID=UPI0012E9F972|nr:site-specific integrase [Natronomonas sp. CBA1123]MUV87803.1 tyrosine-type recombinase/integrase [Natronomonas sp. CBA1123]
MTDDLQPLPVDEGIDRFLRSREPELEESSIRNARTRMNYFREWAVKVAEIENLNDLTGRDLADFVAWRRPQIRALTLQKQLSTVRMALRFWADIEGVTDGLAEKLHAPELPDGAEAREEHLSADRAKSILSTLDQYHYASPRHAMMTLLWYTGMRRSALRAIDADDLRPDDNALVVKNRPDEGTKLKNGDDGERWVYLGPIHYQVIEDSLEHPERNDVTDDFGREPMFTTRAGRPTGDTIYVRVNRATQPCQYGECPHDVDPEKCDALGADGYPSKCPSACGPHAVRRGSITYHLNRKVAPEIVSERCDVSLDVLYKHYDVRTDQEKMNVRKDSVEDAL